MAHWLHGSFFLHYLCLSVIKPLFTLLVISFLNVPCMNGVISCWQMSAANHWCAASTMDLTQLNTILAAFGIGAIIGEPKLIKPSNDGASFHTESFHLCHY
jgi:hypothetical protein